MSTLLDKVATAAPSVLVRNTPVLVAVSGGIDSMVLLRVLHGLSKLHRWPLTAAHLNHKLRGRSSDADERLVKSVARELKMPLIVERADVRALARSGRQSVEMAARQVRQAFLAAAAKENGIGTIATAHHADDQVELFFIRLLRGAGADGLSGMAPLSTSPADSDVKIARPLLGVTRAEIHDYARAERIRWREDASNDSLDHLRNRVRHKLLPLIERQFQPAIHDVILRTIELLEPEADFSASAALNWLRQRNQPFSRLHKAVQRRVLQIQLIQQGLAPDFQLIERIREESEKSWAVDGGRAVHRTAEGELIVGSTRRPEFSPHAVEVVLAKSSGRITVGNLQVSWHLRKGSPSPLPHPEPGRETFDADTIGDQVVLRHWQPGDRFQPIGLASAVKVQDLFTNAKVPRADRHRRLLAATPMGQIFWVEGLRISERHKVRPQTRRVLEWGWRRL